jgi:transketolase
MEQKNNKISVSTKEGFALGLLNAGELYENVFAIGTDITNSVGMNYFRDRFPERFFSVGIAEQNAAGIAAGLALMGKIPVFSTYAVFSALRAADQIRVSICYNNLHVIIGGAHAGISVGPDGATHQALEDISIMRALPNMTVVSPCDATQARIALMACVENVSGPVYFRYGRDDVPDFSSETQYFEIGKGQILSSGNDVCIIATGHMTWHAMQAASILSKMNIEAMVINIHTVKPLDNEIIISAAEYCGAIVCCEEHQIAGGLGSAVSELLSQNFPVPIEFIGMKDSFGESGSPKELMNKYFLTMQAIVDVTHKVLQRKRFRK